MCNVTCYFDTEVLQQVEFLESLARKLGEFSERFRGVETPLQRCEERLSESLQAPPARAAEAVASLADHIHGLRVPLQVSTGAGAAASCQLAGGLQEPWRREATR